MTTTHNGSRVATLPDAALIEGLRAAVRGTVCTSGEPGYDEARTIWNAMIDRRPAVVVRAAGAADVMATVKFAKASGLVLAVRGGGHNIAGNAVCDDGVLLDLSLMKSVRVDPKAKTARVEPGAKLSDFDLEAQAFGLATPLGINSTTGVAGLTLGGGFGWLSRRFGLTVDNLIGADVVNAEGELVNASATQNPELFWGLRGGGGNFGVVTSFEYRLHPVGPEVVAGLALHPLEKAGEYLRAYRELAAKAPDELTMWAVLRKAPPAPFVPAEWHGKDVVVFAVCWSGEREAGLAALAPLRGLGQPICDIIGPMPFAAWQQAFDPLLAPGSRNYWKSHDFTQLDDGLIDVLLAATRKLPTDECEMFIGHLGGAVNRVAADATAYPHRDVEFIVNVHTRWSDAAQDQACVAWARELFEAMSPFATGGVYVNFMPGDESARVQVGAYGRNFARLQMLKGQMDPGNLFCMNQNVAPSS